MKKKLFIGIFLATLFLSAKTIYVKSDALNNDGTSWETAFYELQSALNTAVSGDEIWVAAGTYKPTWDYGLGGARYNHYRMINGVSIYGGFLGTETLESQRNFRLNETILSGDIGNVGDNTDNCYHIFYHTADLWLDESAVLDGFTVRDANANHTSSPHREGGGFYNYTASPTIKNCIIRNNNSRNDGAGIFNYDEADTKIINCSIYNNVSTSGYGGGAKNYHSWAVFTNCIIYNNSAIYGGGLGDESSYTVFTNCTITKNSGLMGGGFYTSYSYPVLNNSIIWGNISPNVPPYGHQFYNYKSTVILNYSSYSNSVNDLVNNSSTFTATNNCLTTDPLFTDSANNIFTLIFRIFGPSSPCIDTGNNAYNTQPYDLAGEVRIQNSRIDRGAHEFHYYLQGIVVIGTSLNMFNNPVLSWDPVAGANSYKIYSSADPYAVFSLLDTTAETEYVYPASDPKMFFYVVATTDPAK